MHAATALSTSTARHNLPAAAHHPTLVGNQSLTLSKPLGQYEQQTSAKAGHNIKQIRCTIYRNTGPSDRTYFAQEGTLSA
jgi:hypothetical protein